MNESAWYQLLGSLLFTSEGASVSGLPAAGALLVLAVAAVVAARRGLPLALRRALTFLLLGALLAFASTLLPAALRAAARPGLTVAALILLAVAVMELAQGVLVDLLFVGWLHRPPPPRILRDFLTLALALTVFLAALRGTLGVNLASLLATSAMISVVLGLALQDTLGSFFAGLALQMEAPLAVGDWIQVGDQLGRVTQVGWRTVRMASLESDEVTLPNSLVTRSTLVNFSRPTPAHQSFVQVRLSYRHPPQEVRAALLEALRGLPGVLAAPAPQALVWEFAESEIVYRARYWIDDYARVNVLRSEVGARLWYALRRAGLEHAYPVRELRHGRAPAPAQEMAAQAATALSGVDLLAPLSEAERALLAERLQPLLFGSGEAIIRQGERGESLFVIVRGRVEVRVSDGGEEGVVGSLGAGQFFGEMSLLTGEPRSATVVAVEDTELAAVTSEDFRRVATANPRLLEEVTRVVASRRGGLAEARRETAEAAAARAAAHRDLLERVRLFFGV